MSNRKMSHIDTIGKPVDEITRRTRRGALKKILAGGGVVVGAQTLPDSWTKPIIESVILPAHAQASDDEAETTTVEDGAGTTTVEDEAETTTIEEITETTTASP